MSTETKAEEVKALRGELLQSELRSVGLEVRAINPNGAAVRLCGDDERLVLAAVESALIERGRQEVKRSERESREWKERLDAANKAIGDALLVFSVSDTAKLTVIDRDEPLVAAMLELREKLAAAERALDAADEMRAHLGEPPGFLLQLGEAYDARRAKAPLRSDRAKADAEKPIPSAGRYVPHEGDAVQGYSTLEQRVRRLERREGIDRWAVDERTKGGRP